MAARRAIAVKSPDESTGPRLAKIISGQRATDEDLGDGIVAQETSHRTLWLAASSRESPDVSGCSFPLPLSSCR